MYSRRGFILGLGAAFTAPSSYAKSQCSTIDLGIQNIRQETVAWCWAAVAQQIILWKTGSAPHQCELVALANNAPPGACCNGNPQCVKVGSLQQIQWLIANFSETPSQLSFPAGPSTIYNTVDYGKAVIIAIQQSPFVGHVVVLRGVSCWNNSLILHINDPMGWNTFSSPIAFQNILPFWSAAIIVG